MSAMATTRDPAHESVNLLTLLPEGHTLTDVSDPAYPSDLDTTRWLYHEPTGLLTNKLYADGNGTAYTYTPDGKLATRTWARGITTSYEYAPCCGNLTSILYSDGTPGVTNQYDRLGRQVTILDGTGEHSYVYDPATLALAEERLPDGTVFTRAQDALGRPSGLEVGRGVPAEPSPYSVAYGYDSYGRFQSVQSAQSADTNTWTYTYLPGSHLITGHTSSFGLHTSSFSRSFEPHRDLIAAVSNTWDSTLVSAFDYTNDALGRRTARADSGTAFASTQANAFGYNARSEVASTDMRNGESTYTFDPIGNRTEATLPEEPQPLVYLSSQLNQYTNILLEGEAPSEPRHDADGNMLLGPAGPARATLAMVWDAENRLIAVTNGNTVVSYTYDYRSRRTSSKTYTWDTDHWSLITDHFFLYDGWNLIQELSTVDGSLFTTNSYVWGLDLSGSLQGAGGIGGLLSVHTFAPFASFAVHLPTFDGNGNVSEYLTTNGTLAAHYEYDAFGRTIAQSGDLVATFTHRFSTKYLDSETGLYYYGYRYYSPELGRWASRDPIEERGGTSLYGSVRNSPLTCVDPLGQWYVGIGGTVGGTLFLPAAPPYGVGIAGSLTELVIVGYDQILRKGFCKVCDTAALTTMYGAGMAFNVSAGPEVTFGPGTPSEGAGVQVGIGVGIPNGPLLGSEVTVDVDVASRQVTVAFPKFTFGVTAYVAIRITGSCTGCREIWEPPGVSIGKVLSCMSHVRAAISTALSSIAGMVVPFNTAYKYVPVLDPNPWSVDKYDECLH